MIDWKLGGQSHGSHDFSTNFDISFHMILWKINDTLDVLRICFILIQYNNGIVFKYLYIYLNPPKTKVFNIFLIVK